MPVSSTIQIAGEDVDLNTPCDVVTALRKRKIAVAAGGAELIIRMNGEEVTFNRANLSALNTLIAEYEVKCREASGSTKRGRARRVRFF